MMFEAISSKIENLFVAQVYDDCYEDVTVTLDYSLMELASISSNDRVSVYNKTKNKYFFAYVLSGMPTKKHVSLNGNIYGLAERGDSIAIFSYTYMSKENLNMHRPRLIR